MIGLRNPFFKKDIGSSRELFEKFGAVLGITTSTSSRNYREFAILAYQMNVIGNRCIKERSNGIGSLDWKVFDNGEEVDDDHPLVQLLKRPNPNQGGSAFFSEWESYLMIAGNNYVVPTYPSVLETEGRASVAPTELYNLRPDRIKVVTNDLLPLPVGYVYFPRGLNDEQGKTEYEVDQVNGTSQILHTLQFNPLNRFVGLSPIEPAFMAIQTHNQAVTWNLGLLQNGARPSLLVTVSKGTRATKDKKDGLSKKIEEAFSGARNSGKTMVIGEELDVKELGITPKDMDYVNSKNSVAKDISTACQVPPILINVGSDATFSNMKEARLSLWEDTLLPEADYIRDELNNWLAPKFGPRITIDYDKNSIPSLVARRNERMVAVNNLVYMTINEKREAAGLEPIDGGDILVGVNTDVSNSED